MKIELLSQWKLEAEFRNLGIQIDRGVSLVRGNFKKTVFFYGLVYTVLPNAKAKASDLVWLGLVGESV